MKEPGAHGGHGGIEDCGSADGGANALCEDELVVFGRDGGHHEAEDVQEGAAEEEVARAVVIVDLAENRSS